MKTELTNELLENRKAAPSADALVEETKNDKLTDDELDRVSGGMIRKSLLITDPRRQTAVMGTLKCPYCNFFYDSCEGLECHIQSNHPEKVR